MASTRLLLAALLLAAPAAQALDNGLARTPPMGWLAWERFVCETDCAERPDECIDYSLFSQMAQRLVDDGYSRLGYQYVNIDDCWSARERDARSGELLADPARFAAAQNRSIGALARELHAKGLKLGIYGDCGTHTCQRFPGQLRYADNLTGNYFQLDARTFAGWSLDSFKFDACNLNVSRAGAICPLMGAALNATGRPMLFSCSWPAYENDERLPTDWRQVADSCNLWRAFGDIEDSWRSVLDTIDYFVRQQHLVVQFHGPGHWFDADQLILGDFGLSHEQERAQMAVWCVWASPLYMSNDLRRISKDSRRLLQNKWAIQVNQDRLGVFGLMVAQLADYLQAFVKPVEPILDSCPSYALVYLDRRTLGTGRSASMRLATLLGGLHAKLAALGLWPEWAHCANRSAAFDVHDIFDDFRRIQSGLSLQAGSLKLRVDPSGVRMVKLIQSGDVTVH